MDIIIVPLAAISLEISQQIQNRTQIGHKLINHPTNPKQEQISHNLKNQLTNLEIILKSIRQIKSNTNQKNEHI